MNIEEKEVLLRDGKPCILRSPKPQEAEEMLDYLQETAGETYFMVRYPDEVNRSLDEEIEYLEKQMHSERSFLLAAYVDGRLAGNVGLNSIGGSRKMRHRASMGIAVRKAYWQQGIGSILMTETLRLAKALGYEQLELGVFADNERAMRLYRKAGFEAWGITKRAFRLDDGTYRDEIVMGKAL